MKYKIGIWTQNTLRGISYIQFISLYTDDNKYIPICKFYRFTTIITTNFHPSIIAAELRNILLLT